PDSFYDLPDDNSMRQELWDAAVNDAISKNNALIDALSLADLIPAIYLKNGSVITPYDFAAGACDNFIVAEDGMSRGFSSIFSLDLLDEQFSFDADHVVSNWSTVYASTDTMVIAEPAQDWWWYWGDGDFDEATNIHRFALADNGTARYSGSGRVDGTVSNQFSLSEHEDIIRVAATTGQWNRWWLDEPTEPENHIYTLAGSDDLEVIGHVGGIAVGEQIWSARFIGERGYLVTFEQTDPLWTVDLSNPAGPAIMGELEVPGVSTYIHPIGDDHLLTIGYGGDADGLDWSIQVSLFDVSDFSNPRLTDNLTLVDTKNDDITSTWGWSEALNEHKAFQYWDARKLLAVPVSYSSSWYTDSEYGHTYVSNLVLVSVDADTGLDIDGELDHSIFYNQDAPAHYWDNIDIRRSIFMGDYIYAISDRGITVNNLDDMALSASVTLPGMQYDDIFYYGIDTNAEEPLKE
ncbi:MAG: hypothetical protein GY868_14705, partial [Deltaproteobacteria bacterium]|nr:hypothetical protein [Deltaproteobacteria bacterium]